MANGKPINIVLAHGFPGFPKLGDIEYFKNVQKYLEDTFGRPNIKIRIPNLGAVLKTEDRAANLWEDIQKHFGKSEKVHIIAHSGGGFDARYLASPGGLDHGDRVASITTISTPHQGALAADLSLGLVPSATDREIENLLSKARDANPLSLLHRVIPGSMSRMLRDPVRFVNDLIDIEPEAIRRFTTEYMQNHFNVKVTDAADVSYRSYAGVSGLGEKDWLAPLFHPTHLFLLLKGQENDGWVTVESAKWGDFRGEIPADHADQIGHDLSFRHHFPWIFRPVFDHLSFYAQVVRVVSRSDAQLPG